MSSHAQVWLDTKHLSRSALLERISVAHGTQKADSCSRQNYTFEIGARVARVPWQPATEQALAEIGLCLGRRRDYDTVGLVELPEELAAALLEARALSLLPMRRGQAHALRDAALARWSDELKSRHGWHFDPAESNNIGFDHGPGDMPNTTTHSGTSTLVGLHLDNWDCLPAARRHEGSNRICINLGGGDRSLQFVPRQAADLFAALQAQQGTVNKDLAREFLEAFPDAPVLRLRILPGEAYIAPTENLIHDGCVHSAQADLTLTLRGRIQVLA